MIFDTDVLIWVERGNKRAAQLVDQTDARYLSIVTYMELMQGSESRKQIQMIKDFLRDLQFHTLPLTENIGHRAAIYIEEYGSQSGLRFGDALIAATAAENNLILATCNEKHFRSIKDLSLHLLRP